MNSNAQSGPRVPVRPAPPPPTSNDNKKLGASNRSANVNPSKQDASASSRKSGLNITKLLPSIIKKPSTAHSATSNKKAPPPRPPPPKFAPKKPIIDLLSGSPPSSPSPTLRSQESGFEEDPDLWRGWPDSSRSTPLLDTEWATQWPVDSAVTPQQEVPCGGVGRTTSMPTIIRPSSRKNNNKSGQQQEEEDHSPPMPNFPPPAPPPELVGDCDVSWYAVALYDFAASHPDDLSLQAGDEVEVLSQVDANWLVGRVGQLVGHFPACFVQQQEQQQH